MRILHWLGFNLMYFRNPPWDTGISPPELIRFIQSHPPGRALDVGCGTGTNAITLAKNGWQVTGIDFALPAIQAARRKANRANIQVDLRLADITTARDIPGPFDLILDMGCYHSLGRTERQKYLSNIERWLSADGIYMIYFFIKEDTTQDSRGVSSEDFQEFQKRFTIIERQDGSERGLRPSAWLTLARI